MLIVWRSVLFVAAGLSVWRVLPEADADLPALVKAAESDPSNAVRYERLGQAAELAGDFPLAERSLLRAAQISRLYQPRYLLAQFYYRRRNRTAFDRWLREALAVAPGDVAPLLPLAESLPELGMQARPVVARQILFFLVKNGQSATARDLAHRLSREGGMEEVPSLLGYCEQVLADARPASAVEVWNTLCRRGLLPYGGIAGDAPLTNADFAQTPLGSAFDWHTEKEITWQYVALQSGATYRLGGEARIFYPAGEGWSELAHGPVFDAPAEVIRLSLRNPPGAVRLERVR
jgi:hypothetical protein